MKTLKNALFIAAIVGGGIIAAHADPIQTVDFVGPRSVGGAGVMPKPSGMAKIYLTFAIMDEDGKLIQIEQPNMAQCMAKQVELQKPFDLPYVTCVIEPQNPDVSVVRLPDTAPIPTPRPCFPAFECPVAENNNQAVQ